MAEMCVALVTCGQMCEELRVRALRVRCCCPALFKGHSVVIFSVDINEFMKTVIITAPTFDSMCCTTARSDIL